MTDVRLRTDAGTIGSAALAAVDPYRLAAAVPWSVGPTGRVVVVGGGKAAAGLAAGVVAGLHRAGVARGRIDGVISVPVGCGRPVPGVVVRETRPPAVNEPTAAVVAATREMLERVGGLAPADVAIAVIAGGGSALLEVPVEGVPLPEIVAVTGALSRAGAGIDDLNTVRRAASAVKAGGLARACRGGRMVVLVLSDVAGDSLEIIASGPCMPAPADPAAARAVLARYRIDRAIAPHLFDHLADHLAGHRDRAAPRTHATAPVGSPAAADPASDHAWTTPQGCRVSHRLVGRNATAVAAAVTAARAAGYDVATPSPGRPPAADERAEQVGRRLLARGRDLAAAARRDGRPRAWIEGGEATVVVPADHGHGGRNQQTVLAALAAADDWPEGMVLASIATDGEDGPTDAAGAIADGHVAAVVDGAVARHGLERCDAYGVLDAAGALVRTGPTGTNVADLRVVLVRPGGRSP
ncbi:MAG: DUF4147 domain-containing protein [Planctomycetaceae bacterium]